MLLRLPPGCEPRTPFDDTYSKLGAETAHPVANSLLSAEPANFPN
ncbi:hypothetical protein FRUB_07178 [Fimbriiglobus ruber]|uniref:Uncharacterized protein n=1 Tax=Fimbriiglobus ruber TaxID=1908690 RepID=A0A225DHP4_9BACT|nr:hypothetical protein FRUB_07178 [Fimbriiglobus ruber]